MKHVDGRNIQRAYARKGKIPWKLLNLKNFLTASNQEFGSRFHSFAAKTCKMY